MGLDGVQHPLAHLRGHLADAAGDPGDGRDGHARELGDLPDGLALVGHRSTSLQGLTICTLGFSNRLQDDRCSVSEFTGSQTRIPHNDRMYAPCPAAPRSHRVARPPASGSTENRGLFLGGEVHYFRLARSLWRERLQQLKDAGCNTLATYVPWLWHELPDGSVDVTGRTHEQRDLAGFLDLANEHGAAASIARPGPFIMAEIKNEGVPVPRLRRHPRCYPPPGTERSIPTRTAGLSRARRSSTRRAAGMPR